MVTQNIDWVYHSWSDNLEDFLVKTANLLKYLKGKYSLGPVHKTTFIHFSLVHNCTSL